MIKLLEKVKMRKVMTKVHTFSILINFGSNDNLNSKLLKIQYMK